MVVFLSERRFFIISENFYMNFFNYDIILMFFITLQETGFLRKQKKNSQYILYAALILLPLILSAVLFFQMRSVINKEIERHADQTSLQFYLQTSSMIHELHSFSSNLADDSEVIRVLSSENGSDVNKSEFCEYISSKVTETRDIKYTYILSESNGRIFSNEGYYSYISIESLLKKIGLVSQNYDFEHYGIDLTLYNESGYAPFCVTPVIDNSGENRGAAIGYIIAALDYRKFIENFHTLDATVCAVYSDNFYISSIIDATKMDDINWSDPDQVNKLVGEPVTCVYRSDSDYNYMVGISNTEYYQPIRLLLTGFCIYFALLLIAGLLILWRLLKKRRDESLSHIKERNLRYILYGHNSRIINEKFVNDAGLSKDPHQLYIVALFFAEIRKKHTFQDIEQAVLHYLPETGLSCTYYDDLSGMVFVFWNENDPSSLEEQVNRVCHSVTQDLLGSQSMFVQICTSSPVQGVIELENAFHQTSDMHEKMDPVHHSKPVVNMSDIDRTTPNESDSFMRSLQVLMNALIAGKYDQIPENVRQKGQFHIIM